MRHNCVQQLVVDLSVELSVVVMWQAVCDLMWYKGVVKNYETQLCPAVSG